ncbi:hypothetical protein MKQ70_01505 [Chitinophaga sedimenti]|uniref:hypothetical protein n=1 Tax=Chitinophaga sedimenti TaxID=2033606 RepID=UPI0020030E23|nr:hypothetical protein [Chitinophaga sedimenti]MCK7553746.1 hypothetical protein [Chitinophaga sedimenti]
MRRAKLILTIALTTTATLAALASRFKAMTVQYFYIDEMNPSLGTDSDDFGVLCGREDKIGCIVFVTKNGLNEMRQLYLDSAGQIPLGPDDD